MSYDGSQLGLVWVLPWAEFSVRSRPPPDGSAIGAAVFARDQNKIQTDRQTNRETSRYA